MLICVFALNNNKVFITSVFNNVNKNIFHFKLYYMNCPNCNETLAMTERLGIEIDYCPKCRGVWLDKGELDKIIEKSMDQQAPEQSQQNPNYNPPYNEGGYGSGGGHHGSKHGGYNKHGRRGFLGKLFDF
jgi:uncharacterized protein